MKRDVRNGGFIQQVGIYSHVGQLEPVDAASLLYYKRSEDGQILKRLRSGVDVSLSLREQLIPLTASTPSHSSFIIRCSAQRIGDLIWAAGDMRCRGFHWEEPPTNDSERRRCTAQDGHSHLIAYGVPNIVAYDPAFAFD
jgi:pyruvate dehydrogenase E1 component